MTAQVDGAIIGMGRAISDGVADAYIQDVTVEKSERGRGIAQEIVARLVARLYADGLSWVALIAAGRSWKLYEKLGFAADVDGDADAAVTVNHESYPCASYGKRLHDVEAVFPGAALYPQSLLPPVDRDVERPGLPILLCPRGRRRPHRQRGGLPRSGQAPHAPRLPAGRHAPECLADLAEETGIASYWYVPEDYVERYGRSRIERFFQVTDHPEYDDYVYLTENLALLKGNRYAKKKISFTSSPGHTARGAGWPSKRSAPSMQRNVSISS